MITVENPILCISFELLIKFALQQIHVLDRLLPTRLVDNLSPEVMMVFLERFHGFLKFTYLITYNNLHDRNGVLGIIRKEIGMRFTYATTFWG